MGAAPDIIFQGYAQATEIWRVADRPAFDKLDDLHCWSPPYVDMRFQYKSDRPLYLVAVRAYRLRSPKTVPNRSRYGGCRSWVPLTSGDAIDDSAEAPVVGQTAFSGLVARISSALGAGNGPGSDGTSCRSPRRSSRPRTGEGTADSSWSC